MSPNRTQNKLTIQRNMFPPMACDLAKLPFVGSFKAPTGRNASQLTPTGIFFVGNLCARFLTTLGKWRSVRLGGSTK